MNTQQKLYFILPAILVLIMTILYIKETFFSGYKYRLQRSSNSLIPSYRAVKLFD